uniref:Putative secreted protein n=1 Tax=Anopheles triannulatus TaxID=58253 RepID=A0A2M4B3M1_9DIPT
MVILVFGLLERIDLVVALGARTSRPMQLDVGQRSIDGFVLFTPFGRRRPTLQCLVEGRLEAAIRRTVVHPVRRVQPVVVRIVQQQQIVALADVLYVLGVDAAR